MAVAYGLGVSPSFQFQAQALRTHVVSVTLTQQTGIPELQAVANLNYGRGEQIGDSAGSGISYVSVTGIGGLVYKFSPEMFLGIHYSYSNVDNKFGGNTFAFDRHVMQISLTKAFY
jgi:opacity protein-like surface antigen